MTADELITELAEDLNIPKSEMAEAAIKHLKKRGPKPKVVDRSVTMQFRIPQSQMDQLSEYATGHLTTMSNVIRKSLEGAGVII